MLQFKGIPLRVTATSKILSGPITLLKYHFRSKSTSVTLTTIVVFPPKQRRMIYIVLYSF